MFTSLYQCWETGLKLYRSCECYHSLSEFMCESVLLCLEYSFLGVINNLRPLQSFCPFFHIDSRVLKRRVWWKPSMQAKCSKISHSLPIVQLWFSVNYHQLQETWLRKDKPCFCLASRVVWQLSGIFILVFLVLLQTTSGLTGQRDSMLQLYHSNRVAQVCYNYIWKLKLEHRNLFS